MAGTKSSCQKKNTCMFVLTTALMTVLKWTTDIISSVVKLAKERKNQTELQLLYKISYSAKITREKNRASTRRILTLVDKVPSSLFSDSGSSTQQTHSLAVFRTSHLPHKYQFKLNSLSAPSFSLSKPLFPWSTLPTG